MNLPLTVAEIAYIAGLFDGEGCVTCKQKPTKRKDRGDSDLTKRIKFLEGKCREAGRAMIELNMKYEASIKEIDRLSEENTNIKTMTDDGKNTSNSC